MANSCLLANDGAFPVRYIPNSGTAQAEKSFWHSDIQKFGFRLQQHQSADIFRLKATHGRSEAPEVVPQPPSSSCPSVLQFRTQACQRHRHLKGAYRGAVVLLQHKHLRHYFPSAATSEKSSALTGRTVLTRIYAAVLDIPDIEAAFPKLSPLSSSSSSVNVWRTCSIAFG